MNTRNATPFTQCGLVLKTNSISASNTVGDYPVSNSVGSINAIRTEYTWYNINLQEILGPDIYNNFEYFTLVCKGLQYGVGQGTFTGLGQSRLSTVVAIGPDWRACTYDVATRRNTSEAIMCGVLFNTVASTYNVSYDAYIGTFKKSPTFNFTLKLKNIYGQDHNFAATMLFPQAVYYFDIVPAQFPEQEPYAQVY